MNASPKLRPLALALCTIVAVSAVAPAFAQELGSSSMREAREKREKELGKKEAKGDKKAAEADLWPNATRKSPDEEAKGKNLKALQELQAQ